MKKILVLAFMSFQMVLWSQNSAQVADFVSFGNRSAGEFTKKYEKEFPLCQLSAHGLNINLGLHYSSDGFRPNKDVGLIGYNWFLNAGGAIVRKVKGVEDDLRDDRPKSSDPEDNFIDGFLVGVKKHTPNKDEMFIFNREITNVTTHEKFFGLENDRYDGRPDEFSFNFHGISGRFFFNVDGQPKVIANNGAHFQIDVTGLAEQRAEVGQHDLCAPQDSEIIITTDNGNKYYFGGNPRNLEWRVIIASTEEKRPVITAWNLRKVVTPNGKELTYEYGDLNRDLCELNVADNFTQSHTIAVANNESTTDSDLFYDLISKNYNNITTGTCSPNFSWLNKFALKKSKLNRINLADTYFVDFNYDLGFPDNESARVNLKNSKRFKLKSIDISGLGIPTKKVTFKQEYFGSNYFRRTFLTELKIDTEDPYKFEYLDLNQDVQFPSYNTADHLKTGYWYAGLISALNSFGSGCRYGEWQNGELVLLGTKYYNYTGDYSTEEVLKNDIHTFDGSSIGLLSKITLPTGGSIQVDYEGFKVKNIKAVSEIGEIRFDNLLSKSPTHTYYLSASFFKDDIDHISEIRGTRIIRKEHDYVVHNNASGTYTIKLYFEDKNILESYHIQETTPSPILKLDDYDETQKIILAEMLFDTEGKPISKTSYRYRELRDGEYVVDAAIIKNADGFPFGFSNKLSLSGHLLEEQLAYVYNPEMDIPSISSYEYADYDMDNPFPEINPSDVTLISQTSYTYDTYNKVKEIVTTGQSDLTTIETFTYIHDYSSSTEDYYNELFNTNRLYPVSKTSYIEKGSIRYPSNIDITTYKSVHGNIVIDKQYEWTPRGTSLVSQAGITISASGNVQVIDTENTSITSYDTYNNDGKVLEVSDNAENYSYILFDAINQGVIASFSHLTEAEFNSIPFSETATKLNASIGFSSYKGYLQNIFSLDREFHESGLSMTTFDAFSNLITSNYSIGSSQDAIAWIQAEEFKYLRTYLSQYFPKTTVGLAVKNTDGLVVQQIDARGKSVYYEYDNKHRLINAKDHHGNIIKHYKYNY